MIAYNTIGDSEFSVEGNGATVFTVVVPDAPINLLRDNAATTTSQIGITWSDGASNGGEVILDYRVSYDQGNGNWVVLQTGVTQRSYVKTTLVIGTTYTFKVEARNTIGYSPESVHLAVICAVVPAQPAAPTTTTVVNSVLIKWNAPVSDNGAAIVKYKVLI